MRRAGKVDANHREIADALKRVGFEVIDMSSIGRGVPDLYVAKGGQSWWLEVKDGSKPPSARQLTADQLKFLNKLAKQNIPVHVVTSVSEALEAVGVSRI